LRRFIIYIILGTLVMSAPRDSMAAADLSTPRQSSAVSPSLSLTTTAGMLLFDSYRNLDASPTYGIRLGYDIIGRNAIDSLGIEAGLEMAPTRSKTTKSAVNAYLLRTDALYSILPRGRLVPYFAVGVGGMYFDGGSNTSPNAFFNYGASVKYYLKDYLALRADIRHIFAYENSAARSNVEATLGLSFFMIYDKDLKRVPPIDSDGDGVPDYLDKCPDTPKGVKVDKDGCPVDSDGDGVPDYLDKCPGTPAGVKVDKDGCPLDSDGDGIPDYLDKCPGTPSGVKVDKDGCPTKTTEPAGTAEHPTEGAPGTGEPARGHGAEPTATPTPKAKARPSGPPPCVVKVNGISMLDSDCDGVPDYLDKCPGTPLGVEVDQDGCPTGSATPVTPAPEKPRVEPAPVEQEEAPVKDAPISLEVPAKPLVARKYMSSTGYFLTEVDRCPPTPESKIVYEEKPLMRLVIDFGIDKADIPPKYFGKIKEIYDFMKKNPKVIANLEGHADYQGPFDYNMTLSRVRVINIKNQILKNGNGDINPERININAYGCSIPVASNKTSEGRRKNRRGVTVLTITVTGPTVVK